MVSDALAHQGTGKRNPLNGPRRLKPHPYPKGRMDSLYLVQSFLPLFGILIFHLLYLNIHFHFPNTPNKFLINFLLLLTPYW